MKRAEIPQPILSKVLTGKDRNSRRLCRLISWIEAQEAHGKHVPESYYAELSRRFGSKAAKKAGVKIAVPVLTIAGRAN